jgi:hypothetical protein
LNASIESWDFLKKAFDYYVVAILGCQSSGKSMSQDHLLEALSNKCVGTLLNLLFGTHFAVMESSVGRQQTTQGVWMGQSKSKSEKEESILVFDVEGTDSRERGEEHTVCS